MIGIAEFNTLFYIRVKARRPGAILYELPHFIPRNQPSFSIIKPYQMANEILLSDMIQKLREELETAQQEGKDSDFKFMFESVELELSVVVSNSGTGKAGIKFWVVDAGGEYQKHNSVTHTFKLTLKPGSAGSQVISNARKGSVSSQ
jgi:hypothetical protein